MKRFELVNVETLTPSSVLITLKAKRSKDAIDFYPGQYAALGFKRGGRPSPMRCFSIIRVPDHSEVLQFAMRIEGDFTQAISRLKPGTRVFLQGPFGNFVVDEDFDRNIIMMAGGIGITPFMGMIRTATEYESPKAMVLLYSCRSQQDIPFYQELLALERKNPQFRVVFFISDGKIDKRLPGRFMAGRINEEALSKLTYERFNMFTYFICGPKSFMRSMEEKLIAGNTEPSRIITEDFTASSFAAGASAPAFSIPKWTYGLTAASLVLGTTFIMGLDLVRAVPRLSQSQLVKSSTPTPAPSAPSSNDSSTPPADSGSTETSGTSSAPSPAAPPTPTPQAQQSPSYYQPPVTSVS